MRRTPIEHATRCDSSAVLRALDSPCRARTGYSPKVLVRDGASRRRGAASGCRLVARRCPRWGHRLALSTERTRYQRRTSTGGEKRCADTKGTREVSPTSGSTCSSFELATKPLGMSARLTFKSRLKLSPFRAIAPSIRIAESPLEDSGVRSVSRCGHSDVASAQSRTRSDLGEPSPVTGESRQHAHASALRRGPRPWGAGASFIVTNATNSARKNSDVSAGTDCLAKFALCMTQHFGMALCL